MMVEKLKPRKRGEARITHFEISKDECLMFNLRAVRDHGMEAAIYPGKYARLSVDGKLQMTDTSMERYSNMDFVKACLDETSEHILVAGLGLGMILHPLKKIKHIKSVTVVEISKDVISLVKPSLKDFKKLEIVHGDIFKWQPPKGKKYNVVYFDIWPDACSDYLPMIRELKKKIKPFRAKWSWLGVWQEKLMRKG